MQPLIKVRLDSLTALRFFAALIVVLSHSTRDLVEVPGLSTLARVGTVGVGFFFALSGFVLTWSFRKDDTPLRFYRRRFARVYPLHFITYLIAFPVLLIAGRNMAGSSVNLGAAITSPLLMQAWFPQADIHYGMNAPSWSLSNEAFFYLLAPLLLPVVVALPIKAARAAIWLLPVVVLAGSITGSLLLSDASILYLNPAWRLLGFVAGAVLAQLLRLGARSSVRFGAAALVTGGAFLALPIFQRAVSVAGLGQLGREGMLDAVMLPLFLLLIFAAAQSDVAGTRSWISRSAWVRLGEWSFALYLTHWLLIDALVGVFPGVRDLDAFGAVAANVALVGLAVGVSAGAYYTVERPLEARLRGGRPRLEEVASATR